MKFKEKFSVGSGIFMLMAVLCISTVVVAAVILSGAVSLPSRNVIEAPLTLSTSNDGGIGTHVAYPATADILIDQQYGQNLTITSTSSWTGTYAIIVTVTAATALTATDVLMNYTIPSGTSTPITWTGTGTTTLTFTMPSQTDTGTDYTAIDQFSIHVGAAYTGFTITFQAVTA